MALASRVSQCIKHYHQGDSENTFIQLCIAIDGTAKNQFPGCKTSVRCKRFLRENLPFVLWSLTNGTPCNTSEFTFEFQAVGSPSGKRNFEDVIYSAMRCSLLHEGTLPENVEFTHEDAIIMRDGRFHFPHALIGALAFAVISSSANANEIPPRGVSLRFGTKSFDVRDLWADRTATKDAIRNGFQCDVEKLLEAHKKRMDSNR